AIGRQWLNIQPPDLMQCMRAVHTTKRYEIEARKLRPSKRYWEIAWQLWDDWYTKSASIQQTTTNTDDYPQAGMLK
ncbi:Hypothetical predicted protein, partial [Pelobates cultripes]